MGNVQIECTKADLYWVHCQICGTDGPRTEDVVEVEQQRVEHQRMHQAEDERCPECHMPLTMHHDPGCAQPCGRCAAGKSERRTRFRVAVVEPGTDDPLDDIAAPRLVIGCSRCGSEETMNDEEGSCALDDLAEWARLHEDACV